MEIDRYADMFKALSNPHRLAIFLRLVSCCPPGTRCVADADARRFVGQLGEELDIASSTLSHHIKELRRSGLLRVERRGKNVECWVDADAVTELAALLTGRIPPSLSDLIRPREGVVACEQCSQG